MSARAAIAGAGLMGLWHARSIAKNGGTVVAVCDPDGGRAVALAARFPGARACADPTEIFQGGEIDVLHVCAPLERHSELSTLALENNAHVLVEKPLTPGVAESELLYGLAKDRSLLLCPVHQFAFQRGVAEAREALPRLGRLLHSEALFCSAGAGVPDAVVADILPHPLSLIERFSPGSLDSGEWQVVRPAAGEMRASLAAGGVSHSITISMAGRPTVCRLLLICVGGTIHINLFHGFAVIEPGAVSRWRKIAHPFDLAVRMTFGAARNLARRSLSGETAYPGLRTLIREFYEAVATGGPSPIPPDEALRIARARERITGTS